MTKIRSRISLVGIALAGVIGLGGCGSLPEPTPPPGGSTPAPSASSDPVQQIASFTVTDLQNADADAVANNDSIAHACYPALIQFVQSLPGSNGGTTVSGAFSAFQRARDIANAARGGIPTYLTMGCGPLYAQVHGDLLTAIAGIGIAAAP